MPFVDLLFEVGVVLSRSRANRGDSEVGTSADVGYRFDSLRPDTAFPTLGLPSYFDDKIPAPDPYKHKNMKAGRCA